MQSNELCKKLVEASHKRASIPESQRYNVHFNYHDLVSRLNKLKRESELKNPQLYIDSEINSRKNVKKNLTGINIKIKKKKSDNRISLDQGQVKRNNSEKKLPDLKSPIAKVYMKSTMNGKSEKILKVKNKVYDFKLLPKIKRRSLYN